LGASGPAIFDFFEHLIMARQFFGCHSDHTRDLQASLASIKRLKNMGIRVTAVWEAVQLQFQSFHHAVQNWAKSSVGGRELRLSDSYAGADSLWSKAMFRAANFDTTGVAWSAATVVKATNDSAAKSALSADEVASIVEGLQQGEFQPPATGGTDSPGKEARGDGIRKHKGLHDLFPSASRLQTHLQPLDEWHDLSLRSRV
jgi:hypothetical protein